MGHRVETSNRTEIMQRPRDMTAYKKVHRAPCRGAPQGSLGGARHGVLT